MTKIEMELHKLRRLKKHLERKPPVEKLTVFERILEEHKIGLLWNIDIQRWTAVGDYGYEVIAYTAKEALLRAAISSLEGKIERMLSEKEKISAS